MERSHGSDVDNPLDAQRLRHDRPRHLGVRRADRARKRSGLVFQLEGLWTCLELRGHHPGLEGPIGDTLNLLLDVPGAPLPDQWPAYDDVW